MDNEEKKILFVKTFLIGIVPLIIIIALVVYFSYNYKNKINSANKYLIVGNSLILQKVGFGYKQIKSLDENLLKFKYDIIGKDASIKNVKMQFVNNSWYFFDKNYKQLDMSMFRVATHNFKVSLADYDYVYVESPLEDEKINYFLTKNNIEKPETYRNVSKVSYDCNGDGTDEIVYTISNYSLTATNYKQNGYMFIVQNGKIVYNSSLKNTNPYTVMEILDLDNDDNYEIIVNKGSEDLKLFDSCYQIYKLDKEKWEIIKDC